MSWWYLSFANEEWLGACIVEGDNEIGAVQEAWRRGINPGGQVMIGDLTGIGIMPPDEFRNRLLNFDDMKALDKAVGGEGEVGEVYT